MFTHSAATKGFTLLETIMALAVSVIIIQATVALAMISYKTWDLVYYKNNFTNNFIDISQRARAQLQTTGAIDKTKLPYGDQLAIDYSLPQGLIKISLNKKSPQSPTYNYQYYLRSPL